MPDEESLVRQAQAGESAALAGLYEMYFDRVYRYVVVRVSNRTDAEDLTEQVFVKCVESIGGYRFRGAPFAAWLFRIAHNLIIDHHRKTKNRESVPLEDYMSVDETGLDDAAVMKLNLEGLKQAMARLTELQRQVVAYRFVAELSITETAKAMNKSEGAIKALQHSALLALRRIMVRPANEAGIETGNG